MVGDGGAQQQLSGAHRDGGSLGSAPAGATPGAGTGAAVGLAASSGPVPGLEQPAIEPVAVIDDAAAAEASLDPMRARLLAALAQPGSASTLAAGTGLARQKINYHLRALERHGLIELVEERKRGNCTERVLRATAASYVISPAALASVAPDPGRSPDQLSARWLLALAARLVCEVGELITRSRAAGQPVATFAIDTEIRFASAAGRAEFARELSETVKDLAARYHHQSAPNGRAHRLVVALHPSITRQRQE